LTKIYIAHIAHITLNDHDHASQKSQNNASPSSDKLTKCTITYTTSQTNWCKSMAYRPNS